MKYAFLLITAVVAIFVAVPSSAEARDYCAGDRRIITYSHGRPVYAVYQIIGRDHWGRPIGRWVTQTSSRGYCPPSRYPVYRSGYGYGRGYGYRAPACPPPYYGRGSSVHFSVGW